MTNAPARDEVKVISLSLSPAPERLRELRALLSPDEVAKVDRFYTEELRTRAAAARGQLREALGEALGRPPASLRFVYGESGKPALEAGELHFNLSHSGDRALLALAHAPIGVDLELHRSAGYEEVGRRFFAAGEVARLLALAPADRAAEFFRTWTAKEAFLKCTGDGITVPLADFESRWTAPGAGFIEVLRGAAFGRRFWLRALDAGDSAAAAVVGEGETALRVTTTDEREARPTR